MIFPLESKTFKLTSNKLVEGDQYNAIQFDEQVAFFCYSSRFIPNRQTILNLPFHVGFEETKNFSMIATGFRRGWGEKHRLKNTLKGDEMYEKGKYLAEPG